MSKWEENSILIERYLDGDLKNDEKNHFVKFKTLSQLSPLLLHVSYYNFGIFWKVSTFD